MNARIPFVIIMCSVLSASMHAHFEKSFQKGCEYFHKGEHALAIEKFEKTIKQNPHCFQAYYNLALVYELKKEESQAIEYLVKALSINPNYTKALEHLAKLYFDQGNKGKAKEHYRKLVQLEHANSKAHHHLGKIYFEETEKDLCIYHLEEAYSQDPKNIHILLDLANAKNLIDKTEEALELYLIMDKLSPDNPSILYNIAYTLKKLGKLQEAMPYYHRTLQLRPDHADAHFGHGLALLLTGHWQEGWKEYEWRWIRQGRSTFPNYDKPMWDGSDLHGKTIYLRAEQGLGDTFQFIRYAKIAKEMGGTVIVAVQRPLLDYMKICPYIDTLVSVHDAPPPFDVYAALVSCPMILNTTLDTVPADIPYLPVDEDLVGYWKDQLSSDHNFKIGICWQGNPNYSTHILRLAVAAKSMPLSNFVPLFDIPGTSFYCLQIKTGTDQILNLSPYAREKLIVFDGDFDKTHGGFMDSAAVVKNLDLVITVDTSVSHFAAGLGIPTWVLLPNPPDWRWMLERTDTPWYPNMRLFRQPTPGDWESVMNTIAMELMTLLDMRHEV